MAGDPRPPWAEALAGDIFRLEYGRNLPASARTAAGFPVMGSNGVVGLHATPMVTGPGIVVGRKGSAGAVHWSDLDFFPIDTAYYVVPTRKLDLRWLYYSVAAANLPGLVETTSIPGLNRDVVAGLRMSLPPLPEQKKIAAILSSVDDAIRATEAVIDQTRRVKQALLQELLTRGIGHTRFKMTEIGEIPEAWEVHILSQFLPKGAVQNGMYLPESEYGSGAPIVRIDSYDHGGRVRVAALKRLQASPADVATFGLREDDLLLNRVNSLSHIAKAALVPALAEPTVFESNMMRIRLPASSGLLPRFLILVLCLPRAVTYFQRRAKKAVAQTSVNQQDVGALSLSVPPLSEQEEIVSMMEDVSDHADASQRLLAGLTATKSALLSALLTGRVRVTP